MLHEAGERRRYVLSATGYNPVMTYLYKALEENRPFSSGISANLNSFFFGGGGGSMIDYRHLHCTFYLIIGYSIVYFNY